MRRGRDNGWLISEQGVFSGVNLGADFCAEHEWGIKELKKLLGVPDFKDDDDHNYNGLYGIERRRCSVSNKNCLTLKVEKDVHNLIAMPEWRMKYFLDEPVDRRDLVFYGKEEMVTAWNESGFLIRVKGEDNISKLKTIYHNMLEGKCAIWLGGGGVFMNAGLCIAIIDAVPEESLAVMRNADIDREKLYIAAAKTGIVQKIDEANEAWCQMQEVETGRHCYDPKWGYFALSPRWANKEDRRKTKHPVVFWLNPRHQDENNYGSFTVEQLEQWLQGKGPIPKKKGK